MPGKTQRTRILTLLLAVILFGAQFHTCSDLTSGLNGSPACQLCSTASSGVLPESPGTAILPVANRIEILPAVEPVSLTFYAAFLHAHLHLLNGRHFLLHDY